MDLSGCGHRCGDGNQRPLRRCEGEAAVGAMLVVVADVADEDPLEVTLANDQEAIGASARSDLIRVRRSAMAFGFGARTGVRTIAAPSPCHT